MRDTPKIEKYRRRLGHFHGFSDQYGAFHIAAQYCGVSAHYPFPGIWQHGCFGPWDQSTPESILYHAPGIPHLKIFCARGDEKAFLERHGVRDVHSIGLPFVYLPPISASKLTNTLLVLPVHSVAGIPGFEAGEQFNDYAEAIAEVSERFARTVVCLHYGDIRNGYWISELEQRGLDWIVGAVPHDRNSLLRTKKLFSQFDFVTTNGWGSHVAYALACGAKVSVWGPVPRISRSVASKDLGVGGLNEWELRFSQERREEKEKYLVPLYRHPAEGLRDESLGQYLIGEGNRLPANELKEVFEWDKVGKTRRGRIMLSRFYTDHQLNFVRRGKNLMRRVYERASVGGL